MVNPYSSAVANIKHLFCDRHAATVIKPDGIYCQFCDKQLKHCNHLEHGVMPPTYIWHERTIRCSGCMEIVYNSIYQPDIGAGIECHLGLSEYPLLQKHFAKGLEALWKQLAIDKELMDNAKSNQ